MRLTGRLKTCLPAGVPNANTVSWFVSAGFESLFSTMSTEMLGRIVTVLRYQSENIGFGTLQVHKCGCTLWVSRMSDKTIADTMRESLQLLLNTRVWMDSK